MQASNSTTTGHALKVKASYLQMQMLPYLLTYKLTGGVLKLQVLQVSRRLL